MTLIVGYTTPALPFGHIGLIVADSRYVVPGTQEISLGLKILRVSDSMCVCPAGLQPAESDPSGAVRTDILANPGIQVFLDQNPSGNPPEVVRQMAVQALVVGWALLKPGILKAGHQVQDPKMALLVGGWYGSPDNARTYLVAAQKNGDEPPQSELMESPNSLLTVGQEDDGTFGRLIQAAVPLLPPWDGPMVNACEYQLLRTLAAGVDSFAARTIMVGGPKTACVIRPGVPIWVGVLP